jgi:alpha-tubulin suppressor-like RCC1 family protein
LGGRESSTVSTIKVKSSASQDGTTPNTENGVLLMRHLPLLQVDAIPIAQRVAIGLIILPHLFLVGCAKKERMAPPFTRMVAIAAGGYHTCALTEVGGVKCWGGNSYGQLGDGSVIERNTPADVVGLAGGVKAITTGGPFTCALTTAGGVKCWGRNYAGQLGDGTDNPSNIPVDVVGLTGGIKAIEAGGHHACALSEAGSVKCWGSNGSGQVGDGTTVNRSTPIDVVGLPRGVQAIATGLHHTCALNEGGGVKCWGGNSFGQLGDSTSALRNTPVDVVGLTSGVKAIAAGGFHTCVLTEAGGVKCWGDNKQGQLGNRLRTISTVPLNVAALMNGVTAIAAGVGSVRSLELFVGAHSCALTTVGGVKCWGNNDYGQLGEGRTVDRDTPADVVGMTSGVTEIAAGAHHSCALTTTGHVKCWGDNSQGQLGNGTTINSTIPVDVIMSWHDQPPTPVMYTQRFQ